MQKHDLIAVGIRLCVFGVQTLKECQITFSCAIAEVELVMNIILAHSRDLLKHFFN